mmetsp:Transcript_4592/g.5302  ORF Transcript_4592/g.5302 Transcript_4592/m.5302 type:complete len:495 (+) Transcript_4592:122-1606(+)
MGDMDEVSVDRATLLQRLQDTAKDLERIENRNRQTTLRKRKQQKKRVKEWEKVFTQSVGVDQGEPYYLNNETGETQWDRPDDYISDTEFEQQELKDVIDFDQKLSLEEVLEKLGMDGPLLEDRDKMFGRGEGGSDEDINEVWDRCEHRMKQFLLCFQHVGTGEQWKNKLIIMDFKLPKNIYSYWQASKEDNFDENVFYWAMEVEPMPDIVRSAVAKAMVITTDMAADDAQKGRYYSKLVDGQWGIGYPLFMKQCELGLTEELEKLNEDINDKPEVSHWLRLMYGVLTYGPAMPRSCQPSSDLVNALLKIMKEFEEDDFIAAAKVFFGFGYHTPLYRTEKDLTSVRDQQPPELLTHVMSNKASNQLIEGFLFLLNSQHTPYDNENLLKQLTHTGQLILQTTASAKLFLVNDIKVLIDIILLEIADLPKIDMYRVEYLKLLYMIIKNTSWQYDGHFRRPEIIVGIDDVVNAAAKGMHPDACKICTEILLYCAHELF